MGRDGERETLMCKRCPLPLTCPQSGTRPTTPACALTRNWPSTFQFAGQHSIHWSQGHCFFIQPTSIHTLKRVLQIFLTDLVIELHTPCLSLCLLRSRDNKHHQARLICFSLIRKISFICTQHFLCPFFLDRRIFPLNDQPCYLHSLSSGYNSPSHSKETYFQILKCVLFSTFIYWLLRERKGDRQTDRHH